jgi:hypothetical protein
MEYQVVAELRVRATADMYTSLWLTPHMLPVSVVDPCAAVSELNRFDIGLDTVIADE